MVFLKKAFSNLRNKSNQAAWMHTCVDVSFRTHTGRAQSTTTGTPAQNQDLLGCGNLPSTEAVPWGEAVAQDQKGWLLQAQTALQRVCTSGNKWHCNILHHPECIYPRMNLYRHTYFSTWLGIYIGHSQRNASYLFPR